MWRFKVSKYKNATPKILTPKQNLPVGVSSNNTQCISSSATFVTASIDQIGAVAVYSLNNVNSKTEFVFPAHSDEIFDMQFNPFYDGLLGTSSKDGTVKLWQYIEENFNQFATLDLPEPTKLAFHPSIEASFATANNQLIQLWDITNLSSSLYSITIKETENVNSFDWRKDGQLLIASNGNNSHIFDFRDETPLFSGQLSSLNNVKSFWLGHSDFFLLSGITRSKQTELQLFDIRNTSSEVTVLQGPCGNNIPDVLFDSDTNMMFVTTKGESNIKFYEFSTKEPYITEGTPFSSETYIQASCLLPKRGLKTMEAEVNRVLCLTKDSVMSVSYVVPRKSYTTFHSDLYPDTPGLKSELSLKEWSNGDNKEVPKVNLDPSLNKNLFNLILTPLLEVFADPEKFSVNSNEEDKKTEEPEVGLIKCQENSGENENSKKDQAESLEANPESVKPVPKPSKFKMETSKCRHLTGTLCSKNTHITHLRNVNCSMPGESDIFIANADRAAFQLNIPGGHLAVLELIPGRRLEDQYPSFLCGSSITSMAWDPFDNRRLVAGTENGEILICKIPSNGLKPDTAPSIRIQGPQYRVSIIKFHPTASDVVAVAYSNKSIVIWDLKLYKPVIELEQNADQIWAISWSPDGQLIAALLKNQTIQIFDPRKGAIVSSGQVPNLGGRGGRIVWASQGTQVIIAGFSTFSERQIYLYDSVNLQEPLSITILDSNPSIIIPFYDEDTRTLFLTGKGDAIIYTYEVKSNDLSVLSSHQCSTPHQAIVFLSKDNCDIAQVEIAKAYCMTKSSIEPLSFKVPRTKIDYFQDDLFPDTRLLWKATLSSEEWLGGENGEIKLLNLCPAGMTAVSEAKPQAAPVKKTSSEADIPLEIRFEGSLAHLHANKEKEGQLVAAMLEKFEYMPLEKEEDEWDE